ARCMLHHANLPEQFWEYAMQYAIDISNCSPKKSQQGITPYACWYGKKLNVSRVRVFGCDAYVLIPTSMRDGKMGDRAWRMIFV
ncbi:hypothetical protein BJ742DRAFT_661834, partial [Cladochytrium replicatum]